MQHPWHYVGQVGAILVQSLHDVPGRPTARGLAIYTDGGIGVTLRPSLFVARALLLFSLEIMGMPLIRRRLRAACRPNGSAIGLRTNASPYESQRLEGDVRLGGRRWSSLSATSWVPASERAWDASASSRGPLEQLRPFWSPVYAWAPPAWGGGYLEVPTLVFLTLASPLEGVE